MHYSIYLSEEIDTRLGDYLKSRGKKRSEVIQEALLDYLKKYRRHKSAEAKLQALLTHPKNSDEKIVSLSRKAKQSIAKTLQDDQW